MNVPPLPDAPRGPLSEWVFDTLRSERGCFAGPLIPADVDPLVDDDLQLALYCLYELAYRGFRGVARDLETDLNVIEMRQRMATAFERALRARAPEQAPWRNIASTVDNLLAQFQGPSLSSYMLERGTLPEFREFMVHRSAYQLKEADPHSWVIPRLPPGPRKAALLEIQSDEYGVGQANASHAELFRNAMDSAGLDAAYGAYVERLPGVTLATSNLISMFGSEHRLAGAVLGHLAVFEMTSVEPMSRYRAAAGAFGLPEAVGRFYDVHVIADTHHGELARHALLAEDAEAEGLLSTEIIFGAQALLDVEDRFARHLLARWQDHEPSFYEPLVGVG